ncbi:receptor expression-enhancing protein 5-like [Dysidea avara]|uniref:receptor expression-enhancing protein 5-like n=1 Tax=Dysidea avara TaxID=196820 RepID=UPI0033193F43
MSEGSQPASQSESKLVQFQNSVNTFLYDEQNPFAQTFAAVEKYSNGKVKRAHVFWGFCAFVGLYLLFGYGAALLANLVGFLYPAYKSCKALETEDKADDTLWLTYWVVFAFFGVMEYFTDLLLWWIPFYFFLKCIFLVWCFVPWEGYNGSMLIYNNIIKKLISKYEAEIDKGLKEASALAKDAAKHGMGMAKEFVSDPSTMQKAFEYGSKVSEVVNEESKKDS